MGIVRDITVEQLTAAIGDIDTSGLAKDTTLQATNTALGNINTTLGGITTNDPPTDTTQQSIASAISGLGATLQDILIALNPFKAITVTLNVGITTANTAVNLGTLSTVTNGVITASSQLKAMSFIGGGGTGNYASGDLTIVSNTLRWYPRVNDTNVSITLAFIYSEN